MRFPSVAESDGYSSRRSGKLRADGNRFSACFVNHRYQGAKGMVLTNRAFRHLIFAVKEAYSSPVACPFTTVSTCLVGTPQNLKVELRVSLGCQEIG